MAEVLDEVTAYLAAQGLGTVGTDIFAGVLLNDPDVQIAVTETGGTVPGYTMGDGLPAYEQPRLQVWVRSAPEDYPGGKDKARLVWKALSQVLGTTLSGTYYQLIQPVDSPALIERDDVKRCVFVFNAAVQRRVP